MARTRIQLEGYSGYAVVAALSMNVALKLWSSTPNFKELHTYGRNRLPDVLDVVYLICSLVSMLGGLFATMVFALVGVYAKVALGKSLDTEAKAFLLATHPLRQTAYHVFVASLMCSVAQFEMTVCARINEVVGEHTGEAGVRAAQCVALLLGGLTCYSWWTIMQVAKDVIYNAAS